MSRMDDYNLMLEEQAVNRGDVIDFNWFNMSEAQLGKKLMGEFEQMKQDEGNDKFLDDVNEQQGR